MQASASSPNWSPARSARYPIAEHQHRERADVACRPPSRILPYDSVRAPIAGIVATMPSVVGETVASPAVTIVGDGEWPGDAERDRCGESSAWRQGDAYLRRAPESFACGNGGRDRSGGNGEPGRRELQRPDRISPSRRTRFEQSGEAGHERDGEYRDAGGPECHRGAERGGAYVGRARAMSSSLRRRFLRPILRRARTAASCFRAEQRWFR